MDAVNNLERLVKQIINIQSIKHSITRARPSYSTIPYTNNYMLNADKPVELQTLPIPPFARVGAIGDGNCLLHSILFSLSPTYRSCTYGSRQFIADIWRLVLLVRVNDLKEQADILYADIGGWEALEESFARLPRERTELDIEMAPLITRIYGHNCLAIQIRTTLTLEPVVLTFRGFEPRKPTVLINYLGGGTDFGSTAKAFYKSGHYEAIVGAAFSRKATSSSELRRRTVSAGAKSAAAAAKPAASKFSATIKKAKIPLYLLDDTHTQYSFVTEDLGPILDMFHAAAAVTAAYVHPKGL